MKNGGKGQATIWTPSLIKKMRSLPRIKKVSQRKRRFDQDIIQANQDVVL
jgi:hypothetical protein